jgi:D-3-phosphoglycerate dehydrogenase / 2-oxoglutarate reductase
MTRPLALVLDRVGADLAPEKQILEPLGINIEFVSDIPDERERQLSYADGLLLNRTRVTSQLFDAAPRCRAVATYGIGHDHIDLVEARARGVVVTHVPDYCTGEVADHTLALLLALARGVGRGDAYVKAGGWGVEGVGVLHRLSGQALGLVGYGRIARAVAARAQSFGLRIHAFDPLISPADLDRLHVTLTGSLQELLREVDHLSLHLPLLPETHHLISQDAIGMMRPGSLLVNTSRGALVDMRALIDGLDSGVLAGAALDVFADEPPDVALLAGRNVILTPHAAYYSVESMLQLKELAAQALGDALLGRVVANRLA